MHAVLDAAVHGRGLSQCPDVLRLVPLVHPVSVAIRPRELEMQLSVLDPHVEGPDLLQESPEGP